MSERDQDPILVVDDDKDLCKAVASALDTAGYRALCAHDGREALDILAREHPRLVVADIRMPVMDGIEFLGEAHKVIPAIPVIMTTGFPDLNTAMQAIHNGAYDYLVKPFQPQVLFQKIRQALNTRQLAQENVILAQLASLHEIGNRLAGTHDLDALLDFTLDSSLKFLDAQAGSIELLDGERRALLIVRHRGVRPPADRSSMADAAEWPISKWVVRNGRSLLIAPGSPLPEPLEPAHREDVGSALSAPLKV
ncbi:MAG: response regulator, partial [Chitinivibrionales bacterium]|nr:response regulator [Chitinivibrionales bacterium]MBD3394551.1 response regulator [Chitinivibrionales bacterium]